MANTDEETRDPKTLSDGGPSGITGSPPRAVTRSRAQGRARPGAVHVLLFVLSLAVWLAVANVLCFLIVDGLTQDFYFSDQARDAAIGRAAVAATAGSAVYAVMTIGLIASRVGYRFRDGWFVVVPFYSWIFVARMLWRWTALPDRYWDQAEPSGELAMDLPPTDRRRPTALVVGVVVVMPMLAGALGLYVSQRGGGADDSATVAESAEWVTVTDIDGVRFDMPRRPHHSTEPIPGTDLTADLYYVDFDNMAMAAFADASELPPGDTRTDAQILRDSANGLVTNIVGTIVDSRPTEVDGEPGLDLEATTPREGGMIVLARVALAGDLFVGVQTVFDENDRDIATAEHNRMARSIRFDGQDAGVVADPSVLNGMYRLEWTLEELVAAGVPDGTVHQFGMAGVYTWSLHNGELEFIGEFPDRSRLECGGTYEITAEEVSLQRHPPCPLWLFTANWELTDAGLVLTDALLDGASFPELDVWMSEKPWTKVD
jgi:hypothetical protein